MIKEQCPCCGLIDTLFQYNGKAMCGACLEEIRQTREDALDIARRKAEAVKANRAANAGFVAYEAVIRELREIKQSLSA